MVIPIIIAILSGVLTVQGIVNLYCMLYAWEDAEAAEVNKSPTDFFDPRFAFTAIIPARNEEKVIGETITAVAEIDYPDELKEIIVVCRGDDTATLNEAVRVAEMIKNRSGMTNIQIERFQDEPVNKPHALNVGLKQANGDVVVIFDAEDQPHKDIYKIVNTVMSREAVDVVQCGVQLMNFRSSWFATWNVLEYFFWFKSVMHLFSKQGVIPLGGNTVFFKKDRLVEMGGWDEVCLTEDAEIGLRLSVAGAVTKVIYDEKYATREETPATLKSFVSQRTRWNQGFMQILLKGQWWNLKGLRQKLLAVYLLIMPELQALLFFLMPVSAGAAIMMKLPVWLTLVSFVPLIILVLQLITFCVGLYEFTRDYKLKLPLWLPIKLLGSFWLYLAVLGFSSFRAVLRILNGRIDWEKTLHINAHRQEKLFRPEKV